MLYLFDKVINPEKKLQEILIKVYGINYFNVLKICNKLGFNPLVKIKFLNEIKLLNLEKFVLNNFFINNKLKFKKNKIINDQINLKIYKGFRKIYGLPSRGQNTHSNSKTSRKFKIIKNNYEN